MDILYLTPVFPASSTHRYDASAFDRVDPLLGGDGALASLTAVAHRRGMRVIGDLTLNHCGAQHDWFTRAKADRLSSERELFYFDDSLPNGYESWLGIPSLPKLDWSSPELRRRMTEIGGGEDFCRLAFFNSFPQQSRRAESARWLDAVFL